MYPYSLRGWRFTPPPSNGCSLRPDDRPRLEEALHSCQFTLATCCACGLSRSCRRVASVRHRDRAARECSRSAGARRRPMRPATRATRAACVCARRRCSEPAPLRSRASHTIDEMYIALCALAPQVAPSPPCLARRAPTSRSAAHAPLYRPRPCLRRARSLAAPRTRCRRLRRARLVGTWTRSSRSSSTATGT